MDHAAVLRAFPHPILTAAAGVEGTGYLDGWGGGDGEVNVVDVSWGDRFDEVQVCTRTHAFPTAMIGLDEIAGMAFGPMWDGARDRPGARPAKPPGWPEGYRIEFREVESTPELEARTEERFRRMRQARARAIRRSRRGATTVVVGGTPLQAYVIEHSKAFAAAILTPAGGFATVAGRGVTLDAVELSLGRDPSAIAAERPEPWADA